MTYSTFTLLLAIEDMAFHLEVSAIDLQSAMADVSAAYDAVKLIQWSVR